MDHLTGPFWHPMCIAYLPDFSGPSPETFGNGCPDLVVVVIPVVSGPSPASVSSRSISSASNALGSINMVATGAWALGNGVEGGKCVGDQCDIVREVGNPRFPGCRTCNLLSLLGTSTQSRTIDPHIPRYLQCNVLSSMRCVLPQSQLSSKYSASESFYDSPPPPPPNPAQHCQEGNGHIAPGVWFQTA